MTPPHFWEGLVPAAITLCAEDKVVAEDLCPCYVSFHRLGYLGTELKDVSSTGKACNFSTAILLRLRYFLDRVGRTSSLHVMIVRI